MFGKLTLQPRASAHEKSGQAMEETSALDHQQLGLGWSSAVALLQKRPWLTISWIAHPGRDWHIVVHDGVNGPALHFDSPDGPTFVGATGVIPLAWGDVTSADSPVNWVAEWGPADDASETTPKVAAYRLLSALVNIDPTWTAQPARFIEGTSGAPSIYALRESFPTIDEAVDSYLTMLGGQFLEGELAARQEYWHEPMWLLSYRGVPAVIIDESGHAHAAVATDADLDVADGHMGHQDVGQRTLADDSTEALTPHPALGEDRLSAGTHPTKLRVYIDFAAIFTDADLATIRAGMARGSDLDQSELLANVGREFACAFGSDWWATGLPHSIAGGVEWTLHISDVARHMSDLLRLAATEPFVGYFFTGGRLMVDRPFAGEDCDVYITSAGGSRVERSRTQIVQLGTDGFRDWGDVARYIDHRRPA
ncbi:hypothetical protein QL996_05085 [Planococcus sp. APC 4015]|nr:hypothetical protein [Planococcus sp. APC 4015]